MWQKLIRFRPKIGVIGLLHLLLLVSKFNAQTTTGKITVYFLSIDSKDTLDKQVIHEQTEHLDFLTSDLKYNYDQIIIKKECPTASVSLAVPAMNKCLNRYFISTSESCTFPFNLDGIEAKKFLCFGGNSYLEEYNALIENQYKKYVQDTAITALRTESFMKDLLDFEKKFKNAQVVGYHAYYLVPFLSPEIKTKINPKILKNFSSLIAKQKGFFYNEMKKGQIAKKPGNCKSHTKDTLVLQSTTSFIDPSLVKDNIHVVLFWATWCGPCKPLMKQLSDLNLSYYQNEPVFFDAVSSEDDFEMLIKFFKEHPEYKGVSFFHDNLKCMSNFYEIKQYPTLLIFDKNGKLISRDPEFGKIKEIIDTELVKEK